MKKLCLTLALLLCTATMSQASILDWLFDSYNRGYDSYNRGYDSYNYSSSLEYNIRNDAQTQRLIAIYRQNPTENNRMNLKNQIGVDYDRAVARQQEKLAELRRVTNNQNRINAMQECINDMHRNREHNINQALARYAYSTYENGHQRHERHHHHEHRYN